MLDNSVNFNGTSKKSLGTRYERPGHKYSNGFEVKCIIPSVAME